MLKYYFMLFFQIKYTEAILSNSTRKLLRFEIAKVLIALLINKLIVSFIIIFGTLSFHPYFARLTIYDGSEVKVARQRSPSLE